MPVSLKLLKLIVSMSTVFCSLVRGCPVDQAGKGKEKCQEYKYYINEPDLL